MGTLNSKEFDAIREFSNIEDVIPDAVIITDENGQIMFANRLAMDLFGYPDNELIGKPFSIITHFKSGSPGRCHGKKRNGEYIELEIRSRNVHKNYKKLVCLTIREKLKNAKKTDTDKSYKTQEQIQIESLNRALEGRFNEIESFSYAVSHDLRAPLRGINGFTALFMKKYSDHVDEEGRRLLKKVAQNVDKMESQINDLVTLFTIGISDITLSLIDMDELVRSTLKSLNLNSKIKVSVGNLGKAYGDISMIRQVLNNLLSNAVKFSMEAKKPELTIGCDVYGNESRFFIKDNGIGFDEEYNMKLFGIFQRLHDPYKYSGNGVGLAIVKQIIARHGGRVWATGKENEGATFYFSLSNR